MLVLGAGGLATQLFEDLVAINLQKINFWSEAPTKYPFIGERYPILTSDEAVRDFFATVSNEFVLCIGGKIDIRKQVCARFTDLGGSLTSFISPFSRISPYGTQFGQGTLILNQVNIEPGVILGSTCLVNKTANIGHGSIIGDFCEIGPGVIITGEVEMGNNCYIGTGAIIHPKIKLGNNVTIAAGAVVTKNVPDDAVVAGVAAEIKFIRKIY